MAERGALEIPKSINCLLLSPVCPESPPFLMRPLYSLVENTYIFCILAGTYSKNLLFMIMFLQIFDEWSKFSAGIWQPMAIYGEVRCPKWNGEKFAMLCFRCRVIMENKL